MTPDFAKDFIAFQKGLKPLKRNATGEDGKPYADLSSIFDYIRPRLPAATPRMSAHEIVEANRRAAMGVE